MNSVFVAMTVVAIVLIVVTYIFSNFMARVERAVEDTRNNTRLIAGLLEEVGGNLERLADALVSQDAELRDFSRRD